MFRLSGFVDNSSLLQIDATDHPRYNNNTRNTNEKQSDHHKGAKNPSRISEREEEADDI